MPSELASFSEIISEKGEQWNDAFRVYARAHHPTEDLRAREEWERLFQEMINKRTKD